MSSRLQTSFPEPLKIIHELLIICPSLKTKKYAEVNLYYCVVIYCVP